MSVYTRDGDSGKTALIGGLSVDKWDDRIVANGAIDELNANLGLLKSSIDDDALRRDITAVQKKLTDIMALVAGYKGTVPEMPVRWLEEKIDGYERILPKLTEFVIYGECRTSAEAHVARAVARRCETHFAKLAADEASLSEAAKYLNRLSDYLFVLARYIDFERSAQCNL